MTGEQETTAAKRARISEDADRAEVPLLVAALRRFKLLPAKKSTEGTDSVAAASWRSADDPKATLVWPLGAAPDATHAAVLELVPEARFVVTLRVPCVAAVARLAEGVRMLSQTDAGFYGSVAYCDGIEDVPEALNGAPRQTSVLVLRREGAMLVFAPKLEAVYTKAFFLSRVCRKQLLVGSRPAIVPDPKVMAHSKAQFAGDFEHGVEWPAVKAWMEGVPLPVAPRAAGSPQEDETSEVAQLRMDVSRAHKKLHEKGMDEMIWNHISAKVERGGWLITPGDRFWNFVEPETLQLNSENVTADILHSAIYAATTAKAVVHTHSPPIEAVSCLEEGFVAPPGSEFAGRVAYHTWEGISDDPAECSRIVEAVKAVPGCVALVARNHGAFTFGDSVEEALQRHIAMDEACREQLLDGRDTNVAIEELSAEQSGKEPVEATA